MLGWAPTVATDEGVETLLRWVRENRSLFEQRPLAIVNTDAEDSPLAA